MSFISTFDHTNSMTDNIIDRDKLQQNLIDQILDDMDLKTLMQLVGDQLDASYDMYTVDELITEAKEYYPHLLEESNTYGSCRNQLTRCHTKWAQTSKSCIVEQSKERNSWQLQSSHSLPKCNSLGIMSWDKCCPS